MHPTVSFLGLTLPSFGLMMSCGMLAAFALLFFTRRYVNLTEDDMLSAIIVSILCGLLGSKLLYWITEIRAILANPAIFKDMILQGLVFYGSLIGGLFGLFLFAKRKRFNFFMLADLIMPSLVLGQAFGRIGCFLAGCCYGCETHGWLAVTFPTGCVAPAGIPLVPTQLLESAFLFLLTVVLVWILSKKLASGTLFGLYLIFYGVWRFIIEFFRSDPRGAVGALSTSQFIAIFAVAAGFAIFFLARKGVFVSRETLPSEGTSDGGDTAQENSTPIENITAVQEEHADTESEGSDGDSRSDGDESESDANS